MQRYYLHQSESIPRSRRPLAVARFNGHVHPQATDGEATNTQQ